MKENKNILKWTYLSVLFLISHFALSLTPCENYDGEIGESEIFCNVRACVKITYMEDDLCQVEFVNKNSETVKLRREIYLDIYESLLDENSKTDPNNQVTESKIQKKPIKTITGPDHLDPYIW